jgi:NAD(P)-dependent dehydrogenase (short-subunit alcohol dehydrogenase family)
MSTDLLADRLCLVTGSSRGIGLGIARLMAFHGATVILHGRAEEKLRAALAGFPDPARHFHIAADLSTSEGILRLTGEAERHCGKLDVLIHSAGILGPMISLESYPPEAWHEVLYVNLTAPFLLTQALLPTLTRGDRASVILISSGVGRKGRASWGAYSVSKFGVEGLTQVWAEELRRVGIRVNAVNPGGTRTQMRASAYPQEDPSRLPTPEEIAPIFVWLARPDVDITGASLEAREWTGRDPAL